MKIHKYKITTSSTVLCTYYVNANKEKEVKEKWLNGDSYGKKDVEYFDEEILKIEIDS